MGKKPTMFSLKCIDYDVHGLIYSHSSFISTIAPSEATVPTSSVTVSIAV